MRCSVRDLLFLTTVFALATAWGLERKRSVQRALDNKYLHVVNDALQPLAQRRQQEINEQRALRLDAEEQLRYLLNRHGTHFNDQPPAESGVLHQLNQREYAATR